MVVLNATTGFRAYTRNRVVGCRAASNECAQRRLNSVRDVVEGEAMLHCSTRYANASFGIGVNGTIGDQSATGKRIDSALVIVVCGASCDAGAGSRRDSVEVIQVCRGVGHTTPGGSANAVPAVITRRTGIDRTTDARSDSIAAVAVSGRAVDGRAQRQTKSRTRVEIGNA